MSLVKFNRVHFNHETLEPILGPKMLLNLDRVRYVEEYKCEKSLQGFNKMFRVTLTQGSVLTVVSAYLDTLWQQTGP